MDTPGKHLLDLVGAAAVLGGLVFVGLQMKQEQAISIAELQQEMISSRIALSELEATHSEVLAKANSGAQLSDSERLSLEAVVNGQWAWSFFGQRRWDAIDHPARDFPVVGFAQFLRENPGARKIWDARQENLDSTRDLLGISSEILDAFDEQLDGYLSTLEGEVSRQPTP